MKNTWIHIYLSNKNTLPLIDTYERVSYYKCESQSDLNLKISDQNEGELTIVDSILIGD